MSRSTLRRLAWAAALLGAAVAPLSACAAVPGAPASAPGTPAASRAEAPSSAVPSAAQPGSAAPSTAGPALEEESIAASAELETPSVAGLGAPTTWASFRTGLGASLGVDCAEVQVGEAGTQLDATTTVSGRVYMARCVGGAYRDGAIGAVFFEEAADVRPGLESMIRDSVGQTSWVLAQGQWAVLVSKSGDGAGRLATKVRDAVGGDFVVAP